MASSEQSQTSHRVVHFVRDEEYVGSHVIEQRVSGYEKAQAIHPDCVMWLNYPTGDSWKWYYTGGPINHWRVPHPNVKTVPQVLLMMKLTGAI